MVPPKTSKIYVYVALWILLHYCALIKSITVSKYVHCFDQQGSTPINNNGWYSSVQCPQMYFITSCNAVNSNSSVDYNLGSNLAVNLFNDDNICIASSIEGKVIAHARCCNLTDYNNSYQLETSPKSSTGNDVKATQKCLSNNHILIGCAGDKKSEIFDGIFVGNESHIGDTSQMYPTDNMCTSQNGQYGDGVWSDALCYNTDTITDNYVLNCWLKWGAPSNANSLHTSFVSCPVSHTYQYFMTSCHGYSPQGALHSYSTFNDTNTICYASDTGGSDYAIASAICCTMTKTITITNNPTISPTYNPTFIPTMNPTLLPTYNPTNFPTITPTHNPSITSTINPSKLPTTNPTMNPTLLPTYNPTNFPTLTPTLNPLNNPSKLPTKNPTLLPTYNPTNLSTLNSTHNPSVTSTMNINASIITMNPTNVSTELFDGHVIVSTGEQNDDSAEKKGKNKSGSNLYLVVLIIIILFCCVFIIVFVWRCKHKKNKQKYHINVINKQKQNKDMMLQMSKCIEESGNDNINQSNIIRIQSGMTGNTPGSNILNDEFIVEDDEEILGNTTPGNQVFMDNDEIIVGTDEDGMGHVTIKSDEHVIVDHTEGK